MEATILCDDQQTYYDEIISKYNTNLQQKRIELSMNEIILQMDKLLSY